MELFASGRIVLAVKPADWRWGIRSLTSEARTTLGIADFCNSDVWAVWINRHRDAVRILHYTEDTITLYEQRLRKGSKYPVLLQQLQQHDTVSVTRDELRLMLQGHAGPFRLTRGYCREQQPTHGGADAPAA